LQNIIDEKEWDLDPGYQKHYIAYYYRNRRVFGVNLKRSARLTVWITKSEAVNLSNYCNMDNYLTDDHQAVYPKHTEVDELLPILEYAYKKLQEY
jgi:hypothetical protein